jgi:hypothetical protein
MARRRHVTEHGPAEQAMFLSQLAHAVASGNARVESMAVEIGPEDRYHATFDRSGAVGYRERQASFTYQLEVVSSTSVDPYCTREVPSLAEMRLLAERQLERIASLSSSAVHEDVAWAERMLERLGELAMKLGARMSK